MGHTGPIGYSVHCWNSPSQISYTSSPPSLTDPDQDGCVCALLFSLPNDFFGFVAVSILLPASGRQRIPSAMQIGN